METSREALQDDHNTSLPPLMNPTMLEASDDLTNLSHLNEPAGMAPKGKFSDECLIFQHSSSSHTTKILAKGDLHIQRYCSNSDEPLCSSRFIICFWYGTSIHWQATSNTSSTSIRNSRRSLCVSEWLYDMLILTNNAQGYAEEWSESDNCSFG